MRVLLLIVIIIKSLTTYAQSHPNPGMSWESALSDSVTLSMIWIPAGEFLMGSPESEPGRRSNEGPQHFEKITDGYWLGETEVTIGQWKLLMRETLREHVVRMLGDETVYDFAGKKQKLREYMYFDPAQPDKILGNENDELPMYFVSWYDAIEFCKRLTGQQHARNLLPKKYAYSLPTEVEWEYACRGGTTTSTYAGELAISNDKATILDDIAWYAGNSSIGYEGRQVRNGAGPRNVASRQPNAWGLYDMAGNLWEWCRDQYSDGAANRGGSWGSSPNSERSAIRAYNPLAEKSAYRGFRVALYKIKP